MTIHIQMLQDIATHARAMADSMPPQRRMRSRTDKQRRAKEWQRSIWLQKKHGGNRK